MIKELTPRQRLAGVFHLFLSKQRRKAPYYFLQLIMMYVAIQDKREFLNHDRYPAKRSIKVSLDYSDDVLFVDRCYQWTHPWWTLCF